MQRPVSSNGDDVMRARLLVAVAALIPLTAVASNWVSVVILDDGTTSDVEVTSLRRDENIVRAWIRWNYAKPEQLGGVTHQSDRMLIYYNCVERTFAVKQYTYFSGQNLDGEIVLSAERSENEIKWIDVAPDSSGDATLNYVCKNGPK